MAIAYWVVAAGFFVPSVAYAYIDPATTTYIVQIVTALVVMLGVSLSIFLYKFNMVSARVKYGLYGIFYRGQKRAAAESRNDEKEYVLPEYVMPDASAPPSDEDMAAMGEPVGMEKIPQKAQQTADSKDMTYLKRLKTALPLSLAIALCFVLFVSMELVIGNPGVIPFSLRLVMPVLLAATAACFVALLFVIPIFRGRAYMLVLSLAMTVLIAGYIQGNFLNTGLGELTGDAIDWSLLRGAMVLGAVVWIAVFACVVFLMAKLKRGRFRFVVFVPVLLIIMQASGLVSLTVDTSKAGEWRVATFWEQASEVLTIDKQAQPAYEKNAIIFVLDRFDQEYVEGILEAAPDFFEPLDGFTMFDDNISYAASTFPSVAGMLTGHIYRWDRSDTDYFDHSWANAEMMHTLREHGIDVRLYMDKGYAYNDIEQLRGIASNIMEGKVEANERVALVKFLKYSAFKYMPMALKPPFWLAPIEFVDVLLLPGESAPYLINDFAFYSILTERGLSLSDDSHAFSYYHLLGPHGPLYMDENIERVHWSTPVKQAMGCMRIVYEYLDQLRGLGLYEQATIVITGDHGDFMADGEGLERPALTALFVKPSGSAGMPLAYSNAPVSPDYLHGTVMGGFFGEAGGFGPGYFAVEDAGAMREYDFRRYRYEISGGGRDFDNWSYVGEYSDEWEGRVN
ncbi:MAG: hypothetical protein FWH32_00020 [Clostridiales bacterium]|nr:hypothetical protein [Clostridiales bacterium]